MKKLRWFGIIGMLLLLVGCSLTKEPNTIENEPTIIQIQNEITEVYKEVSSGCVGIYASGMSGSSIGSGVIYKENNGIYYVVTNYHVIANQNTYKIYRGGSKYYRGTLVGGDSKNDIAVLTFSLDLFGGEDVYVHDIFSYDEEIVIPGQTTLAIGCPISLENYNTLTTGVVSRVDSGIIQTNAQINPGNSGGGLFNLSGRLIGINSRKIASTNGEDSSGNALGQPVEGLGFAISLDVVKKCITDIEKNSSIIERPLLGLKLDPVNRYISSLDEYVKYLPNTVDEALVVVEVQNGAAKNAGVLANDVILTFDGHSVATFTDLSYYLNVKLKGDQIKLGIYRPSLNQEMTINVTL